MKVNYRVYQILGLLVFGFPALAGCNGPSDAVGSTSSNKAQDSLRLPSSVDDYSKAGQCVLDYFVRPHIDEGEINGTLVDILATENDHAPDINDPTYKHMLLKQFCPSGSKIVVPTSSTRLKGGDYAFTWACYGPCTALSVQQ